MRKISDDILMEALQELTEKKSSLIFPLPANYFIEWLTTYPEETKKSFKLFQTFLETDASEWSLDGSDKHWDFGYYPKYGFVRNLALPFVLFR